MRRASSLAAIAASLAVAGCAAPEPARLHFGVEDAPEGKRLMWPPEPEVPRFLYAGQLVGESNFRREKSATDSVGGFLRWFAGVLAGDAPPVELQRPQSGAVGDDGRVYVTDISRQAVFVFDAARGRLDLWEKAEGLASFAAPVAIALEADGRAYVTDAELGIVARLAADGTPGRSIGRGQLRRPTGLAFDRARGELYVADTYAHDVKVFDREGRLARTLGRRGEGAGEFNFPTHLAFADGRLYVTDTMNSRVQVLEGASGRAVSAFGARGLYVGNLVRPKGVAVDSERNVYVVESYYDHLLVFDREGRFLMSIGGVGANTGRFYLPAGVWTDRRDRVFVADMFNGRVVLFQLLGGGADGEQ